MPDAIAYVQLKSHTIALHGNDRMTVVTAEGTPVAEEIDEATFQARFPDLYKSYERMTAKVQGLDATLSPALPERAAPGQVPASDR